MNISVLQPRAPWPVATVAQPRNGHDSPWPAGRRSSRNLARQPNTQSWRADARHFQRTGPANDFPGERIRPCRLMMGWQYENEQESIIPDGLAPGRTTNTAINCKKS